MPPVRKTPTPPRGPFVLDTRELGRRPGSMRRLRRTVPTPAGWALDMSGVPQGSPVELTLRLEAVMEGVLVSGVADALLQAECGRCLAPVTAPLHVELQELFVYPDLDRDWDEDEEVSELCGDLIDLEPVLRDAVVLSLPFTPLCRPDCAGLCPTCGTALADAEPGHHHDDLDPRWAALGGLLTDPKET
jgi:uncharacterized protein